MKDIHLYLGAHKTATTHLQGIFIANRETLQNHQIKLSVPQDIRKTWLPRFFTHCNQQDKEHDYKLFNKITQLAPQEGLWILSEENIAGISNDLKNKAGLYPKMDQRLSCLKNLFKEANIKLFFSLRSYDSFYRSSYSEVIRNRGYLPFDEFYNEQQFKHNSWFDTISRCQTILPQENITLWKYEDFRSLIPELIHLITTMDQYKVNEFIRSYKESTTRPSLSNKTVKILDLLHSIISPQESLQLVERINQKYPIGSKNKAFMPFDQKQRKRFAKQYKNDIKKIKKAYPDIHFLKPAKSGQ